MPTCSNCHSEHDREGQRQCRLCHSIFMQEYRRRKRARERALRRQAIEILELARRSRNASMECSRARPGSETEAKTSSPFSEHMTPT